MPTHLPSVLHYANRSVLFTLDKCAPESMNNCEGRNLCLAHINIYEGNFIVLIFCENSAAAGLGGLGFFFLFLGFVVFFFSSRVDWRESNLRARM